MHSSFSWCCGFWLSIMRRSLSAFPHYNSTSSFQIVKRRVCIWFFATSPQKVVRVEKKAVRDILSISGGKKYGRLIGLNRFFSGSMQAILSRYLGWAHAGKGTSARGPTPGYDNLRFSSNSLPWDSRPTQLLLCFDSDPKSSRRQRLYFRNTHQQS